MGIGTQGKNGRIKLCRIVTVPQTFQVLLPEQLRCIVAHEIELTLVSSPGHEFDEVLRDVGAQGQAIPIARKPSPLADVRSLLKLLKLLFRGHFDVVHSSTPKAGLLTALAAWLARVPVRMHTFTGQPWVELTGFKRLIPRECDRIIGKLATQCYADSASQRDFLISEGLVAPGKIAVMGEGSISGVDLRRFSLPTWGGDAARQTRHELGLPSDALVIVFVGRVTRDKGIVELLSAFELIAKSNPSLHLLLVGPFEPDQDPLPEETMRRLKSHPRIHRVGMTATPEKFLAAADIFCLPSYREGFGSVVIEAAAMELPAVVTRVTGLVDAVIEGVTGLITPPKDIDRLAATLQILIGSKDLRHSLGQAARQRVVRDFDAQIINEAVVAEYFRLARQNAMAHDRPGSSPAGVTLAVQTTVPGSFPPFFKGQLAWLQHQGLPVHTVSAPGEELQWVSQVERVRPHAIPMTRRFSPLRDLLALWRLVRLYRRFRFTIVHAFTPKGGFLGMLAAALAGCPVRVFSIWGLAAEAVGFRVRLMFWADKVSCLLAHRVFVECPSIGDLAVAKGLCPRSKLVVLPAWSTCSLDRELLDLTEAASTRAAARQQWGIPPEAIVVGFVGRVVRDKGIHEIIEAFESLAPDFPALHLLIVGVRETENAVDHDMLGRMDAHARIHCTGFQNNVSPLLSAMDILVHPSYREGLPTAPLEASARELPVIATRIPGCIDAVQDGMTGRLIAPRDAGALAGAIRHYLHHPELRRLHGRQGRERVLREYDRHQAWADLLHHYQQLLAERGVVPRPAGGKDQP